MKYVAVCPLFYIICVLKVSAFPSFICHYALCHIEQDIADLHSNLATGKCKHLLFEVCAGNLRILALTEMLK